MASTIENEFVFYGINSGGGQVISALAVYSDDLCLNPDAVLNTYWVKINEKEAEKGKF